MSISKRFQCEGTSLGIASPNADFFMCVGSNSFTVCLKQISGHVISFWRGQAV